MREEKNISYLVSEGIIKSEDLPGLMQKISSLEKTERIYAGETLEDGGNDPMNNYNKGMTIILDDNNEYIILNTKIIDDIQYAYVQNVKDSNDDAFVSFNGNTISVVTYMKIIDFLMSNL